MSQRRNHRGPGQDVLGALFLYVLIAAVYGAWTVTRDPRWTHLSVLGSGAFLEHCLAWPRLIAAGMRGAVIGPVTRRLGVLQP